MNPEWKTNLLMVATLAAPPVAASALTGIPLWLAMATWLSLVVGALCLASLIFDMGD